MFFDVGIKDFIDVLLVALLLYYTYKLMKASGSIKVFTGILVFILIWLVVTQILEMKLLGSIFDTLMNVGVIALIVLFQDEIRRFLLTLGSHRHVSALAHFFSGARKEALKHDDIMPVVMACLSMGKQKVGALIVIEHTTPLDEVVNWLLESGYIPSFCTACYREGRTGDRFMSLVKSGQIANCCGPNALMTLKEYLEDYASEDTRIKGMKLIAKETDRIPNPKIREIAIRNLKDIAEGKRDFRF